MHAQSLHNQAQSHVLNLFTISVPFPRSSVPRFLQALERRLEQDILRFDVSDIVLDHCPALRRVYLPYVTNQAYQEQTYQRLL